MPLLTVATLSSEEDQVRVLSSVLFGPTCAFSVTRLPVTTWASVCLSVSVSAVWVTVTLNRALFPDPSRAFASMAAVPRAMPVTTPF